MKIVKDKIEIAELREMAKKMHDFLVKAVVDIEKEMMIVDLGLHSDGQEFLIEEGSEPKNLWGINIWPEKEGAEFVEFDSMINIKPAFDNRTRGVDNKEIREKIILIVEKFIKK